MKDFDGRGICPKCDQITQWQGGPCTYCESIHRLKQTPVGRISLWLWQRNRDWCDVMFTPHGRPYIQEYGPEDEYQLVKRKFIPYESS